MRPVAFLGEDSISFFFLSRFYEDLQAKSVFTAVHTNSLQFGR